MFGELKCTSENCKWPNKRWTNAFGDMDYEVSRPFYVFVAVQGRDNRDYIVTRVCTFRSGDFNDTLRIHCDPIDFCFQFVKELDALRSASSCCISTCEFVCD